MNIDSDVSIKGSFITPLSKMNTIYLGTIGDSEDYYECFEQIRKADANDVIRFNINSGGGNGFTAIQFLRAMAETKALTIASVEGQCASAATMIFLSAKVQEITPHSIFVFHNYSGAAQGKGNDMYDQISHMQTWSDNLIHDIYKHFLTSEEMKMVMSGKDIYMNAKQVAARLEQRNQLLRNEVEMKTKKTKKLNETPKAPKAKKVKKLENGTSFGV